MAKRRTPAGPEEFDAFYREMLGERWDTLREAMTGEDTYTELREGLVRPYYLDPASVVCAEALDVQNGNAVLDMCAAPGGKTLVLARMAGPEGSVTANDRSSNRRRRLIKVIGDHLPGDLRAVVTVTGHDAGRWCLYEQDVYDRILLDVPCSSERHVLNSPKHLEQWSPARTRKLSAQAYGMLAGALLVLKPGGILVYSTCTVSRRENDDVIKKLIEKKGDLFEIVPYEGASGEAADYGWQIWPDRCGGAGPIYFVKLRRLTASPSGSGESGQV